MRSALVKLTALTLMGVTVEASAGDRLFVALQDFDDLPLGPLGEPWTITSVGAGTATVVADGPDGDQALLLDGSGEEGHYFVARIDDFSVDATPVVLQVQVKPDPGAGWVLELGGAGPTPADRRIRLLQRPGSDLLEARTAFGATVCGVVPPGSWSKVELLVSFTTLPTTFEVRIDGADTACIELATGIEAPITSVAIADSPKLLWSGTVLFDDVHLWAGVQ